MQVNLMLVFSQSFNSKLEKKKTLNYIVSLIIFVKFIDYTRKDRNFIQVY